MLQRTPGLLSALCVAVLTGLVAIGCESKPRELWDGREGAPTPSGSGSLAQCSNCHGSTQSPAPPASTRGVSATTDIAVGAHASHLKDGSLRAAVACTECHAPVADLSHMDGVARVAFGQLAQADGAVASWSREGPAPTCATYCHGATLGGGSNTGPIWTKVDGTQASCGACHGLPPPPPHPATNDCSSCHTGYSATTVDVARHIDGIVQVGSGTAGGGGSPACGSCHGIPPPPPHIASTNCGSCHMGYSATAVNTSLHQNGRVDVLTAAACGSCHGIPPPPPHTTSTQCGTCHSGYTATQVNTALHQNGTVNVVSQSCNSCHGLPPSSGQHTRGAHRDRSCGDCHPGYTRSSANASLHVNGTPDVGNRITSFDRATGNCTTTCHETERW